MIKKHCKEISIMKYTAPVAELVALEAINVLLASAGVCDCDDTGKG